MNINNDKHAAARIFADNLKQARAMRMLSMRALASKIGISSASLSYYENAKRFPSGGHLVAVASALELPVDFFLNPRTGQLDTGSLSFRKLSSTSKSVQESIAAKAKDALRRIAEAMAISGSQSPVMQEVPSAKILDEHSAEDAAMRLRDAWNLGVDPIKDVVDLLEQNGLVVLSFSMPVNVSGFCGEWGGMRFVACNADHSAFRRRSTLLHEVAHLLFECDDEKLAQHFAGAFLLPKESFSAEWGPLGRTKCPSDFELLRLKIMFGASMAAVVFRASQLGLLNDSQKKSFFIWHPKKKPEQGDESNDFGEKPSRFRALVFALIQEGQITMSKGASLLGESIYDLRSGLASR